MSLASLVWVCQQVDMYFNVVQPVRSGTFLVGQWTLMIVRNNPGENGTSVSFSVKLIGLLVVVYMYQSFRIFLIHF